MPPPVFRFAPSPNGYLHLGHAYSALLNFDLARAAGGRFLLRIEDIDAARCKPEFEAAIYRGSRLARHRLGSSRCGGNRSILPIIATRSTNSSAEGLVYPSFESRAEIARLVAQREANAAWPRDPDGAPLYPGDARSCCRRTSARGCSNRARLTRCGSTWRRRCARAGDLAWTERGEGPDGETGVGRRPAARPGATSSWRARRRRPAIISSVVIDDALQGVTDVVRGQDLFWSTSVHRLLQALLGLPQPPYRHHRLMLDAAGQKLSKSTAATGLARTARRGRDAGRYPPPGRPA